MRGYVDLLKCKEKNDKRGWEVMSKCISATKLMKMTMRMTMKVTWRRFFSGFRRLYIMSTFNNDQTFCVVSERSLSWKVEQQSLFMISFNVKPQRMPWPENLVTKTARYRHPLQVARFNVPLYVSCMSFFSTHFAHFGM